LGDQDKAKALDLALTAIERTFGKGAVMRLGQNPQLHVETIPSGSLAIDVALGVGGIPRGRITEIFGQESSGKTTLGYHIIAEAQKLGGNAAFIDAEHAIDPQYAGNLGVNIDELLVAQPGTGEEALEIMDALVRSGAVDVIVLDSVAALVPKAEINGEMGDSHVGLQARLMSQALRKLGGSVSKSKTAAVFVNQVREKIGVMYGNPEVTPGGRALKFWASIRIDIRRIEAIKHGNEVIGARTRAKIVKNKVAPPFRQAEFDIMFGQGISRSGGILDMGVETGVIAKAGTWFTYGDLRLGQGRENAKRFMEENASLMDELDRKVREAGHLVAVRSGGNDDEASPESGG
jgi:recombination protein RecA